MKFGAPRRYLGFYAGVTGAVVAGMAMLAFDPSLAVVVSANVFFAAYLAVALGNLHKLSAAFLRRHAAEEDAPAPIILLVMAAAVVVSAVSLILVMAGEGPIRALPLALGVASVALGWFAVHTMWAMHYAYEYYQVPEATPKKEKSGIVGGLLFPGDDEPDGTAFMYFAYVLGATAQTADTDVTSNVMRRLVLLHGVFAFFFNTVILASAVNIVVSLGS